MAVQQLTAAATERGIPMYTYIMAIIILYTHLAHIRGTCVYVCVSVYKCHELHIIIQSNVYRTITIDPR